MIFRVFAVVWVAAALVCGVLVVADATSTLHGRVTVDFGTDSPQFAAWLETHGG